MNPSVPAILTGTEGFLCAETGHETTARRWVRFRRAADPWPAEDDAVIPAPDLRQHCRKQQIGHYYRLQGREAGPKTWGNN